MNSKFKFITYKIDTMHFNMHKNVNLLLLNQSFDPEAFKVNISFRNPIFAQKENVYIAGMEFDIILPVKIENSDEIINLIDVKLGIAGAFQTESGRLSNDIEENFIKIHTHALLVPFARSAITTIISTSGLGNFLLPLFNIHELAKAAAKDLIVEELKA